MKLNDYILKTKDLEYFIIAFGIFLAFFDVHIEKIIGIKRLPLPESYIILVATSYAFRNIYNSLKVNVSVLIIGLIIAFTLLTGVLRNLSAFATVLGTIWLYKALIAFYVGWCIAIDENHLKKLLKALFIIALISCLITWGQFLFGEFNPFGFNLASSGVIGFMDNPNKNGFILLYGFIYSLVYSKQNKDIFFFFFLAGIFFTQSRQIIILVLTLLFYIYVVVKRNYIVFFLILFAGILLTVFFKNVIFYRFTEFSRIVDTGNYFRIKALIIGFDVLKDNWFFGSGPGTFGGIIAKLDNSIIHTDYKLFEHWKYYRDETKVPVTIDMYWPHLLVESGLLIFCLVLYFFKRVYNKINKISKIYKASFVLKVMFIILLFMSVFSMSLEASYSSITIFLLIGANLSFHKNYYEKSN